MGQPTSTKPSHSYRFYEKRRSAFSPFRCRSYKAKVPCTCAYMHACRITRNHHPTWSRSNLAPLTVCVPAEFACQDPAPMLMLGKGQQCGSNAKSTSARHVVASCYIAMLRPALYTCKPCLHLDKPLSNLHTCSSSLTLFASAAAFVAGTSQSNLWKCGVPTLRGKDRRRCFCIFGWCGKGTTGDPTKKTCFGFAAWKA